MNLDRQPTKGYDAIGNDDNKKYEIKTRKANSWNKPTKFPIAESQDKAISRLANTDYIVYVGFDENWKLIELLKIPSEEVKPNKYGDIVLTAEILKRFSVL